MIIELELDADSKLSIVEVSEIITRLCENIGAKVFDMRIRPQCRRL